jgi:hypothetical protein
MCSGHVFKQSRDLLPDFLPCPDFQVKRRPLELPIDYVKMSSCSGIMSSYSLGAAPLLHYNKLSGNCRSDLPPPVNLPFPAQHRRLVTSRLLVRTTGYLLTNRSSINLNCKHQFTTSLKLHRCSSPSPAFLNERKNSRRWQNVKMPSPGSYIMYIGCPSSHRHKWTHEFSPPSTA